MHAVDQSKWSDLVGRDVMGLNGFKGAKQEARFCSSGGGMWKCLVWGMGLGMR